LWRRLYWHLAARARHDGDHPTIAAGGTNLTPGPSFHVDRLADHLDRRALGQRRDDRC
jgi:hypothetical protein